MAARLDGWKDLGKLLAASATILVPLGGLILYQGSILRSEIRDLRTEMRAEIGGLHAEVSDLLGEVNGLHVEVRSLRTEIDDLQARVADLSERVAEVELAVARIEARRALRPMLALRFAASGEGATYGRPGIAADLLLARARPEINSMLSAIDQDARSDLANTLWEDRANISARAVPIL